VVLVIVVCYIEVLSKEWFLSLWFAIQKFCQRSGSRHCGLLYRSFVKGMVLVIVVCYIEVLSKEWFSSLWFVI
jgi:hypothetical protein